jgi:hypothetical protein
MLQSVTTIYKWILGCGYEIVREFLPLVLIKMPIVELAFKKDGSEQKSISLRD